MHNDREMPQFQTGTVLLISFSHLMHDTYSSFLAPLLPLLIEKLGFSYALAGFLPAAQRLPSLINPWLGVLADKIRLRYFVIFAPAVTAISMSLLGSAPSYPVLVVLLAISGLSASCFHVPSPVMIRQIAGKQVGKGMSFFMFGGELARTVGPLLVVGAVSLWGVEGTYRLIPLGVLASIFLYITFKDTSVQQHIPADTQVTGLVQTVRNLLPLFAGLTGLSICMGGLKALMISFLPSYLTTTGFSVSLAGIALAVHQGGGVLGVLTAGALSDYLGRKFILLVVALAVPPLTWIFLLNPGILAFPILAVLGFFLLSTGPVMLAIVQESKSDRPAYVNGIYMMINFVVSSSVTIGIGVLSDWIGLESTFWLSTLWFFGTIPCLFLLPGKFHLPGFVVRKISH
ncbi:MFS transporter [candidate division KSB3 bacterium]|uniref:MFS transporter n=1 Tax=candidate division KSB3 bacterium TaxID=2044937 RepID=A0A9D5Q5J5_9BACT|nr:MFS transporter [candidate division KSB3 bacterium]MBD3324403.1 MFS transporter [candidate division KSB3 bacterium]